MPTENIKGTERERAQTAYTAVSAIVGDASLKKRLKDYKSYVKKAPMMIKANGLAATLTFIYAKKKDDKDKSGYAYKLLFDHIDSWVKCDSKKLIEIPEGENVLSELLKKPSPVYRMVTIEVLAYLNWLRRFAEGMIEGEDS